MFNLQVIIIALGIIMFLFYMLGRSSRRNSDEQAASIYFSIFFIALFIVIILLFVYFGMNMSIESQSLENPEP